MPSLIIEILDRFGKVKERYNEKDFPVSIGRDYSNSIIINDPYISPNHLSINYLNKDNGVFFTVSDSNSENGLFNLHPFTKQKSIEIKDDTKIRIGHTDIRFRFTNHPIKETLIDLDKPSQFSMLLNSDLTLPFALLIFSIAFIFNDYIEATTKVTFQNLLSNVFPLLVFMLVWAMAWSALSKIVTHRLYFYFHATWVSSLTLLSIALDNIASYFEFSFSIHGAESVASYIFGIIVTSILFYGHLHYSTTFTKLKAKRFAIMSSILILSLIELSSFLQTPDFSNKPQYSFIVRPAAFIFVKEKSLDTFFSQTTILKTHIDNEALNSL